MTTSKQCTDCGQTQPLTQFWKRPYGHYGRCKACSTAMRAAELAERSDGERSEYYRKARVRASARYHADPDRGRAERRAYNERNRPATLARVTAWRKANPDRVKILKAAYAHRRRDMTKDGPTAPELRQWLKAQKMTCHWCGCDCAKNYVIDHIMPLSKGGRHEFRNLAIACASCNCRKAARHPVEWARLIGKLL